MKIIDFELKGNVARFYLGDDDCTDYYGDDWNDAPYDCNAGTVYDRFIKGYRDVAFACDYDVMEPCDDYLYTNVPWCKDDMKDKKVPCVIAVLPEPDSFGSADCFSQCLGQKEGVIKFWFGDEMEPGFEFVEAPEAKIAEDTD